MQLRKHLHEVLSWEGPLTHRQYVVWQAWFSTQWDEPSRNDYYLMQVATALGVKDPHIKFEERKQVTDEDRRLHKLWQKQIDEAMWKHRLGVKE